MHAYTELGDQEDVSPVRMRGSRRRLTVQVLLVSGQLCQDKT